MLRCRMFNLRLSLVESCRLVLRISRLQIAGAGCAASGIGHTCSLARDADERRSSRFRDVSQRICGQLFGIEPLRSRSYCRNRGQNAFNTVPDSSCSAHGITLIRNWIRCDATSWYKSSQTSAIRTPTSELWFLSHTATESTQWKLNRTTVASAASVDSATAASVAAAVVGGGGRWRWILSGDP